MTRDNKAFGSKVDYEVGSQPPSGYVHWHEWAASQHKGGLRQKQCPNCGLWNFPQEVCQHSSTTADKP